VDAFFVAFTKGKCFVRKFLVFFSCLIVVVTLILVVAIFLHVWRLPYVQIEVFGISNSTVHWIGWIGTIYVAFATPFYPVIKRRFPLYLKKILNIHVLGNLLGVLLVSIHFAIQVTRPADNYPHLGTGIVLYAAMILLLLTGFLMISPARHKFSKQTLFLHAAYATTFYTVIIIHIIQDAILVPSFT